MSSSVSSRGDLLSTTTVTKSLISVADKQEELSLSDFDAYYNFLPLNGVRSVVQIECDVEGVPLRHCSKRICHYPTDDPFFEYEVTLMRELSPRSSGLFYSLEIIWQVETPGETPEKTIWFKTDGPHKLEQDKSIISIKSQVKQLNGHFLVDSVSWEIGQTSGPTLFSIFADAAGLMEIPCDSLGRIWSHNQNSPPVQCNSQYEINTSGSAKEGIYRVIERSHVPQMKTGTSARAVMELEEENPELIEDISVCTEVSGLISEATMDLKITEKQNQQGTSSQQNTGNTFTGFHIPPTNDKSEDLGPVALFGNAGGTNVAIEDSGEAESSSRLELEQMHGSSENGSERPASPACTEGAISDVTDWTPNQAPSETPVIVDDTSSEDDEEEIEELLEHVPFSKEELGLEEMDYEMLDKKLILSKFTSLVHEMLMEVRYPVRMILFDDLLASNFFDTFTQELTEALSGAIMRKGKYACLVPQKMFGAIRRALHKQELAFQHYGGIILHILEGLERVSVEMQLSLVTYTMEPSPSNPFEHMIKEGELPDVLSFPGYGSSSTIPARMPYLASIIETPDLSMLSDQQIRALFRNASYLMKCEISKPKFLNKMKDYVGQKASGPLRKYQEECVKRFMTGKNFLFVAPTGAGKTKIFVECSRKLLVNNKAATIVVLCPTVPLATQQACVYVVEGFLEEGYWVNTFSSDNPLPVEAWEHLAKSHNVMVLTPQLLLNVIDYYRNKPGYSVLTHIDLLILDECHHVRKEHAYNKIVKELRRDENCKTQVIGFTASPTRSATVQECHDNLNVLLNQLDAQCIAVRDSNAEVQAHVPSAKEETAYAELRDDDAAYAQSMGRFLLCACTRYIGPLIGRVKGVLKLSESCTNDMAKGILSSFFENWAKGTVESIQLNESLTEFEKTDIICSIELLRACNTSLDLVIDAGFESGVRFLSNKICTIAKGFQFNTDVVNWMFPKLLSGVYSSRIIQSIDPALHTFNMSPRENGYAQYPRFIQLVKFLERYKDQETLHGIVFIKSRDGVYHLAEMLRRTYAMRHIVFLEFTGHGQGNKKGKSLMVSPYVTPGASRGMTGSKQQDILERFSSHGRHVLCATSAAEEGINVTTCQFVVRYSVTYTGIQRVQSRGRSRVSGGVFFNIIQKESKETKFLEKSQQEEINMDIVLRTTNRVEHI